MFIFYIFIGGSLTLLINSYVNSERRYCEVFTVLKWLFIGAICIALLESFTPFRLPTSPYSDYANAFGRKSTDFSEFDPAIQTLIRSAPTSFWANPNDLAVAMTLAVSFFLMSRNSWLKISGFSCVLVIIVMTGSRGGFIGLMVAVSTYLIIKGWMTRLGFLILLSVLSVIFYTSIDALKDSENQRLAEIAWSSDLVYSYVFEEQGTENSIGVRRKLIQNGLSALANTGGLGVGGGGSQAVQERMGLVGGKISSMHNFWVEILVDAGVVFFVVFLLWYFYIMFCLASIYKSDRVYFYRYHAGSLFISMLTFLVSAISTSSVIYFFPMWIMYGLAIGLISLQRRLSV